MHPDIRAERMEAAKNRLEAASSRLAEKTGDDSIKEKSLDLNAPVPGVVEVNDRYLLHLEAVVELLEAAEGKLSGGAAKADASEAGAKAEEPYDFSPLVGDEAAKALNDAGYNKPEDVRNASDEDLLALDGVGPAKLEKLRSV